MTEQPGIYAIRHVATRRCYVGSASNISKRWSRHRKDLRASCHMNPHLQAAWSLYGEDAFEFVVLELTADLTAREQYWMDDLDVIANGFNIAPVARSSRGRKWSPEERARRMATGHWDYGPKGPAKNGSAKHAQRETTLTSEELAAISRANGEKRRNLTLEQAREIRERYGTSTGNRRPHARTSGRPTLAQLGKEYGLSIGQMSALVNGRTYREEVVLGWIQKPIQ